MEARKNIIALLLTGLLVLRCLPTTKASHIVPIYCQSRSPDDSSSSSVRSGRSQGMRVQLHTASLYHINPYAEEADASEAVNCDWIFTVTGSHSSNAMMTAVLELQRKGGGQVMAGDAISNAVISVHENGKNRTHPLQSNMTLLRVKVGTEVTVSLNADHSGVSKDQALFIRLFLVSESSCPSENQLFHKYGNSCLTVRPANFICGANQRLDNCSLMTKLALEISADELTELGRNVSFNEDFSRHFLSDASLPVVVSGFLCKDKTLMTCAARTAGSTHGHSCKWRSVPGKLANITRKCSSTSGLHFVTLRVTGCAKSNLSLVSFEQANLQALILLDPTADPETEAPVSTVSTVSTISNDNLKIAGLAAFVVMVSVGIIAYRMLILPRTRDTTSTDIEKTPDYLLKEQ